MGSVDLTIAAVNDGPEAGDDQLNLAEDNALNFTAADILANDSDIDGDQLSITGISQNPEHGELSFNSETGEFSYVPDENYNGEDSFVYTVSDGNGGLSNATVTFTIDPVNDDPVVIEGSASGAEDAPLVFDVSDLISDVDGDDLSIQNFEQPANGSLVLEGTQFTFTPDENWNGDTSFEYTVIDGEGGSDIGSVSLSIEPVNDDPTAESHTFELKEDGSLVITEADLLAGAEDVDGDNLSVTHVTDPANGELIDNGDSTWTFTPDDDWSGETSFEYTVSDGQGGEVTETVQLNVEEGAEEANVRFIVNDQKTIYPDYSDEDSNYEVKQPEAFGTTEVITGEEMDTDGIRDSDQISVTYQDENAASLQLDSGWNSIKNALAQSDEAADITMTDFVRSDVKLGGDGDSSVVIDGAKRGDISTGEGDDSVDVTAKTNNAGWSNTFNIDTGAGADAVSLEGDKGLTEFNVDTGAGADEVKLGADYKNSEVNVGEGHDVVTGGEGEDIVYGGAGNDNLSGGEGDDILYGGDAAFSVERNRGSDTIEVGDIPDDVEISAVGGDLSADSHGFGVDDGEKDHIHQGLSQEMAYDPLTGVSEGLVFDFGHNVIEAEIEFNHFKSNGKESEQGQYRLIDSDGNESVWVTFTAADLDNNDGELVISSDEGFAGIEFRATGYESDPKGWENEHHNTGKAYDSSDYLIESISYSYDDVIYHEEGGNDVLLGGLGNDILYGGGGDDTLDGGAGIDEVYAGSGDDAATFVVGQSDGIDQYHGGTGDDTFRVELTGEQLENSDIVADLRELNDFIQENSNENSDNGPIETFEHLGVQVGDFEKLDIVVDGQSTDIGDIQIENQWTNDDFDRSQHSRPAHFQVGDPEHSPEGDDALHSHRHTDSTKDFDHEWDTKAHHYRGLEGEEDARDVLTGSEANDAYTLDWGGREELSSIEEFNTGAGDDIVDLASYRYEYGDTVMNLGDGKDVGWGNLGDDQIFGGAGNDWLAGNSGDDLLQGGLGDDRIEGNAGDDEIHVGQGDDIAMGHTGNDLFVFNLDEGDLGQNWISGGEGTDTLQVSGSEGQNWVLHVEGDGEEHTIQGMAGDAGQYGEEHLSYSGSLVFDNGQSKVQFTDIEKIEWF
ncbi:cadherin-like domain-containing protein [Piscirickettsia litoralis]|uniref:Cadherin-like domain-containing protein n=1 Tax=Piscirickettsia litoralis TaxID=1891921 RepID=A0ABX2ZZW4_9GAMM|nr:cadherin-like domain-containing protein [Piscirickettsia litoralis]ODN42139.1 hypothetical protein BGC07_03225 [Piscirickettsia litoralis]